MFVILYIFKIFENKIYGINSEKQYINYVLYLEGNEKLQWNFTGKHTKYNCPKVNK